LFTQLSPVAHSHEAWQRLRHAPLTQSWLSEQSMFSVQEPDAPLVPPLELLAAPLLVDEVVALGPVVP
jgi:hypothetical protein